MRIISKVKKKERYWEVIEVKLNRIQIKNFRSIIDSGEYLISVPMLKLGG